MKQVKGRGKPQTAVGTFSNLYATPLVVFSLLVLPLQKRKHLKAHQDVTGWARDRLCGVTAIVFVSVLFLSQLVSCSPSLADNPSSKPSRSYGRQTNRSTALPYASVRFVCCLLFVFSFTVFLMNV